MRDGHCHVWRMPMDPITREHNRYAISFVIVVALGTVLLWLVQR